MEEDYGHWKKKKSGDVFYFRILREKKYIPTFPPPPVALLYYRLLLQSRDIGLDLDS